jgi:WD40 repeat protein/serine/threonine protein kinase
MTTNNAAVDQDSVDSLMGQITDEFLDRLNRGERPEVEEYARRYPALAAVIRQVFPALEVIRRAPSGAGSLGPGPDSEVGIGSLGDFHLLREIGRGGMGVVYEAQQLSLHRRVALKVLPMAAALDSKQLQRFQLEAQAAACLHHTNIVPVHAVGCERGVPFYAMQYIEGRSLAQLLAELRRLEGLDAADQPAANLADISTTTLAADLASGRLAGGTGGPAAPDMTGTSGKRGDEPGSARPASGPEPDTPTPRPGGGSSSGSSTRSRAYVRTVAQLGIQAAEALDHAHTRGILHRDIKPGNLLLDDQGQLWVADFGLAQIQGNPHLTLTGDILGTLRYMSPEQALARRVVIDGRTDIYSLGVTLYELLTLRPAIDGQDRGEILRKIAQEEPAAPRRLNPAVPRDLETILLKAMAKEPAERYATAKELADELRRFLEDKPIRARRVGLGQRAVLWARRRPAEAALVAVGSLAALALLVGTAWSVFWYGPQLRKERAAAATSEYFQHMAQANTAWRDGNMGRLEQLLDTCPVEHRDHWEWRYLKRQCHRELLKLEGHTAPLFEIQYSRDGKYLVSASLDNTLKLWGTTTGQALRQFVGHTNSVTGVALNPVDGNQLASASWDGTVRIWDATSGREIRSFALEPNLPLWDIKYSPDGNRLAATCGDGSVRIWDLETGEPIVWPNEPMPNVIRRLAFSPDGKWLAAPGVGFKVDLFRISTGQAIPLVGHRDMALGVAFSPDGKHVATGSFDRTVRIWELATGETVSVLRGHEGVVWGLAFSPGGDQLASASSDPSVKLWDWKNEVELRTLRCHGGTVHDVAFSPDGARLATASHDLTVKLWDLADNPEARILTGHAGPVHGIAFHPAGKVIASAGQDKTIKLWDVATGAPRTLNGGHDAAVLCVAFSPGGEILASGDKKGIVRFWDTASGRMSGALADDHGGEVSGLAFRPDGEHLAVAGKDGGVWIWQVKSSVKVGTFRDHERIVTTLAYSPDGRFLASGSADRRVIVHDTTGRVIFANEDHSCWVHGVAYSPDGRYFSTATGISPEVPTPSRLVSVSGDGTLNLFDTTTYEKVRDINAHGADVWSIAFSPDGARLASASIDRTIKLWDVMSGKEVLLLRGHAGGVLGVAFSPDGNLLASSGRDGTVRIWDARSWPPSSRN